ncbi:unnamed protein product [Calypogeia fissa]
MALEHSRQLTNVSIDPEVSNHVHLAPIQTRASSSRVSSPRYVSPVFRYGQCTSPCRSSGYLSSRSNTSLRVGQSKRTIETRNLDQGGPLLVHSSSSSPPTQSPPRKVQHVDAGQHRMDCEDTPMADLYVELGPEDVPPAVITDCHRPAVLTAQPGVPAAQTSSDPQNHTVDTDQPEPPTPKSLFRTVCAAGPQIRVEAPNSGRSPKLFLGLLLEFFTQMSRLIIFFQQYATSRLARSSLPFLL